MGTNIVLLLALIGMIGIWVYLLRDGDGPAGTGRLSGKLSGSMRGSSIRIKMTPPEDEADAKQTDHEASTPVSDQAQADGVTDAGTAQQPGAKP